ncbi:hypothetical protein F0L68_41170 [Solihabitans fulvus]|uniref:Uncharacterized protein n=1 Tax=Solihabitans fulvus TaxID=1892852 RepID=A0A5B2W513_9PSEU|nr:hypothetical protein F0L68_41170 [Solihabitans fulvus]
MARPGRHSGRPRAHHGRGRRPVRRDVLARDLRSGPRAARAGRGPRRTPRLRHRPAHRRVPRRLQDQPAGA